MGVVSLQEIEQAIIRAVVEVTGPVQVTRESNLREFVVSSVRILRIIAKLERRFDVELDDDEIFTITTVAELAQAIRQQL